MGFRIFDISPVTGTLAIATPFYSPVVPCRGARQITVAMISTAGHTGTVTPNNRFGEEAIASTSDKMNEGASGEWTASSAFPTTNALANTYYYHQLVPAVGDAFGAAFFRMRIVTATNDLTGVKLYAIVRYADETGMPSASGAVPALPVGQPVAAGNY